MTPSVAQVVLYIDSKHYIQYQPWLFYFYIHLYTNNTLTIIISREDCVFEWNETLWQWILAIYSGDPTSLLFFSVRFYYKNSSGYCRIPWAYANI
jgi:hypothetical protein